jgi:hypothetical protein
VSISDASAVVALPSQVQQCLKHNDVSAARYFERDQHMHALATEQLIPAAGSYRRLTASRAHSPAQAAQVHVARLLRTCIGIASGAASLRNISSCRALMLKSGWLNWYGTFQPSGPNLRRSCSSNENKIRVDTPWPQPAPSC